MGLAVERVTLRDWRNFEHLTCELSGGLTVLVGPNATGKTNTIEALQLLTAGESFRRPRTADLVREVCPQRLRTLLLAHISKQCNAPYLALETMRSAVAELGRPVALEVLYQDAPSPLYAV